MDYPTKPIEMDELDQAVRIAALHRRNELKRNSGPGAVIPQMDSGARQVELVGGPLDARRVRVEDARYRLWVVMQPDGEHVWASIDPPSNLPDGTRPIGSDTFSAAQQALHWTPERTLPVNALAAVPGTLPCIPHPPSRRKPRALRRGAADSVTRARP